MSEQKPSVGRIVHYFAYGTPGGEYPAMVPRAAIITEVNGMTAVSDNPEDGNTWSVGLAVLNPTGAFFNRAVPQGQKPGCWDWPPRV